MSKFVVRIGGRGPGEYVRAMSHEEAAKRMLARIARRDLGSRSHKPVARSSGVTDDGAHWWMGELWRRARDGDGWVTDDYRAEFTTRLCDAE